MPPAYTVDADGKRLHSWRTLLLPQLDQKALYEKIDLTKPWNDPANAEAFQTGVAEYRCPLEDKSKDTSYFAFVGADYSFHPTQSRPFTDIVDGLSNTLLVIESDGKHAVHWMSPEDPAEAVLLNLDSETKLRHAMGLNALLGDGSVRALLPQLPAETRRALMTINGGEMVPEF